MKLFGLGNEMRRIYYDLAKLKHVRFKKKAETIKISAFFFRLRPDSTKISLNKGRSVYYFLNFFLPNPANPTKPPPKRSIVAGSGTAEASWEKGAFSTNAPARSFE